MTGLRVAAILAALGTPAVLAPVLVRARGRLPSIIRSLCGTFICLAPLAGLGGLLVLRHPP